MTRIFYGSDFPPDDEVRSVHDLLFENYVRARRADEQLFSCADVFSVADSLWRFRSDAHAIAILRGLAGGGTAPPFPSFSYCTRHSARVKLSDPV